MSNKNMFFCNGCKEEFYPISNDVIVCPLCLGDNLIEIRYPQNESKWVCESGSDKKKFDIKDGDEKPRMHLLPYSWKKALVSAFEYGTKKYFKESWRLGFTWSKIYDAAERHMGEFWDGSTEDEESGLHPMIHAAWNCMILWWMDVNGKGKDDRYEEKAK